MYGVVVMSTDGYKYKFDERSRMMERFYLPGEMTSDDVKFEYSLVRLLSSKHNAYD